MPVPNGWMKKTSPTRDSSPAASPTTFPISTPKCLKSLGREFTPAKGPETRPGILDAVKTSSQIFMKKAAGETGVGNRHAGDLPPPENLAVSGEVPRRKFG